ncbi:MAG: holo-[acyl-carrier-protein] synthase [Candidatus Sumerlaeia bacterium]
MIIGTGVDIVEIERIGRLLDRFGERFVRRTFSDVERAYCAGRPLPEQHYAARFAAKEAFVKAIGTGFTQKIVWRDIGVVNEPSGQPLLVVNGRAREVMEQLGATTAWVSLSHSKTHAVAVVVLEKMPASP